MKISVDGGALNPKNNQRFGTAVFSENLVKALKLYDSKNQYSIYTFKNLRPKLFWLKGRVSMEEFKQKKKVFLALNQALPLYVSGKIISFCHGLSYYFHPQLYSKKDVVRLKKQLEKMIKRSDKIIVSSEKVKDELNSIRRNIEGKIIVLPFGIPFDMNNKNIKDQRSNIKNKDKYFLYVGMDHAVKNIEFIKEAFRKFKELREFKSYKLILVTKNCSRKKLRSLYRNATALLTASYYESFNFPVLEALSQGCPVIGLRSAIIPELETYVNLANNIEEFVKKMKKITKKPDTESVTQLHIKFNWKNYVKDLVKLYK
ncbi:MAG TPA: glycosyltransferase [Patescibacteria group bacterium]